MHFLHGQFPAHTHWCLDNTFKESYTFASVMSMRGRGAVFLHGVLVYIVHYLVDGRAALFIGIVSVYGTLITRLYDRVIWR